MSEQLEISIPKHPIKRPSLVGEELEGMDEIVYVDTESGTNVSLNVIGATILELCDGNHSIENIIDLVLENLSGEREQVSKDIHHILMEFAAYGLFTEE